MIQIIEHSRKSKFHIEIKQSNFKQMLTDSYNTSPKYLMISQGFHFWKKAPNLQGIGSNQTNFFFGGHNSNQINLKYHLSSTLLQCASVGAIFSLPTAIKQVE